MKTLTSIRPLLAAAGLALAISAPARAADLTVTAFGGVWEKSLRTCYVEPFQKKTGKTVDIVLGTPAQWVNQVAANPQKPPIDVFLTLIDGAEDAKARGLSEPIDAVKVPNIADIPDVMKRVVDGQAVVLHYGAAGLAYNEAKIKNPPKSWEEFIERTLKGEWQAALPGINVASTTPTALIWNFNDVLGGKGSDIAPVIAKMKALRDSGNVVFWNDVNQFLTQMQSGEADIGIYWDGRAWAARDAGFKTLNFYYPAPGGVVNPTVVQKIKNGSPLAWDFINFLFSAEPQSCWAAAIQYPVANPNAEYKPEQKARMPRLGELRWPPFAEILAAMPKWVETWNKEVGR